MAPLTPHRGACRKWWQTKPSPAAWCLLYTLKYDCLCSRPPAARRRDWQRPQRHLRRRRAAQAASGSGRGGRVRPPAHPLRPGALRGRARPPQDQERDRRVSESAERPARALSGQRGTRQGPQRRRPPGALRRRDLHRGGVFRPAAERAGRGSGRQPQRHRIRRLVQRPPRRRRPRDAAARLGRGGGGRGQRGAGRGTHPGQDGS